MFNHGGVGPGMKWSECLYGDNLYHRYPECKNTVGMYG